MTHRFILISLFLVLGTLSGCFCPKKYQPSVVSPRLLPCIVPEHIRIALVLGSGGVRGVAHVGVLEELERAGVPIDLIVGCSAGSLVGALYADNPNSLHVKNALSKLKRNNLLDINLWECRYGLSQGAGMLKVLDKNLEADCFDELKIPFIAVATDLYTGELVTLGCGDIVKAVKASCSIPLIYVPVEYEGRILVDGGVIDPVPVRVARDLGAQYVIAVDLRELLPPTFPSTLFGIAERSAEIAFIWQSEACVRGADVVIRPKLCDIGTFDNSKNAKVYEAGKAAAREALPLIQEILANIAPTTERNKKRTFVELPAYAPE